MGLNSILNFFKLDEDEEDAYYDQPYEEPEVPERRQPARPRPQQQEEAEEERPRGGFLSSKPKVVPMNRASMSVNVIKPLSFEEDSQKICDMLLSNRPVIVNLEGFNPADAQRIMDFISGCIYAINGKYYPISNYIFIFSPENVDVSGDSISLEGGTATMPLINREF